MSLLRTANLPIWLKFDSLGEVIQRNSKYTYIENLSHSVGTVNDSRNLFFRKIEFTYHNYICFIQNNPSFSID